MKKFLSNNSWWFYFVLTYMISWSIWALGNVLLPEQLTTITLIIGAFGPFIAAMIILTVTGGASALKQWLKATFNFKVNVTWYLLGGIILPFVIAGIHHIIYLALGGKSGMVFGPEWLTYFAYLISTTLLTGGNEEPGWRGYITPVLMTRFNPFITCIIVGTGRALWHSPIVLTGRLGWPVYIHIT